MPARDLTAYGHFKRAEHKDADFDRASGPTRFTPVTGTSSYPAGSVSNVP